MANESEVRVVTTKEDDAKSIHHPESSLEQVLRSLPTDAVKDLLSSRVCRCCILRFFGIKQPVLSPTNLHQLVGGTLDSAECLLKNSAFGELEKQPVVCPVCLGILQFCCSVDGKFSAEKDGVEALAEWIANKVKEEDHQIDCFDLQVSIPPMILENENASWSYIKRKYGGHVWFDERSISACISLKDTLKSMIAATLEKHLGVKFGQGAFHIRLSYTEQRNPSETIEDRGSKRRKIANGNGFEEIVSASSPDIINGEDKAGNHASSNGFSDQESSELFLLPLKEKPCCLSIHCHRESIYLGGRYLKFSRNVSQTCWMIDDERKGESSVEEIIGGSTLPLCCGDKYKFHAAGREDIDVRMLGSGRPFLIEIQNARRVPSEVFVKEIEKNVNVAGNSLVRIKNLKVVDSQIWTLMREGEAEKQKQYAALVWIPRPLEDSDIQNVSSLKDMLILQKTPIRVLHRRSPLEREKMIHWMKIERIFGASQYFILHLFTQAGTYIKEFVHGDLGRTHPRQSSHSDYQFGLPAVCVNEAGAPLDPYWVVKLKFCSSM